MIRISKPPLPPYDISEINRYARSGGTENESELLKSVLKIAEEQKPFSPFLCYDIFDVKINGDSVIFPFAGVKSERLAKNLSGCKSALVFAATVGIGIDRLVAKYTVLDRAKALMLSALGSERVEGLCNVFNDEISEKYITHPRFSPGYGDLPLEFQKDIFAVLHCPEKIGLTLNGNLLMSPSKSVTAIIGIECEKAYGEL